LEFHRKLGLTKICEECGVESSYSEMTKKGVCKDCTFKKKQVPRSDTSLLNKALSEIKDRDNIISEKIKELEELKAANAELNEMRKRLEESNRLTRSKTKTRHDIDGAKNFLSGIQNIGTKEEMYKLYTNMNRSKSCDEDTFSRVYEKIVKS
jgi:hypothetical protein